MSVVVVAIAVAALVWLQSVLYARIWNKNLKAAISFSEKTAFEGDTLVLTEELANAKLLPLPWIAVKFQVSRSLLFTDHDNFQISDDYYRNDLFSMLMFQKIVRRLSFVCSERGYYRVKSFDLIGNGILMQEKLAQSCNCDAALTVYPRHIDIDEKAIPYKKVYGNVLARRFVNPDPFTFKGIREYQPYDSFKSVNFNATAKTGRMMVNVHDYSVSQDIVILLNLQPYSSWPSRLLTEQAIRLAASLAAYYIGEGVPLRFVSNGRDITTGQTIDVESGSGASHLTAMYEAMARIDLAWTARDVYPMSDMLYDTFCNLESDVVYILISTYCESDLLDVFRGLTESGAESLWILPVLSDMDLGAALDDNMVKWDTDILNAESIFRHRAESANASTRNPR